YHLRKQVGSSNILIESMIHQLTRMVLTSWQLVLTEGRIVSESNYIFPDFMLATRFSKLVVSTLSALPLAIATSAAASASSFRPAAQSRLAFADRFLKVSLTLID